MAGLYYEDFQVGDAFVTPGRTVTEADILLFCAVSGDYNRLHTDAEYMRRTQFGRPLAHGLLGVAMATGLLFRLGIHDGTAVAALGIENWRYVVPIYVGDTIYVEMTVVEKRLIRNPQQGIIVRRIAVKNQRDELCQEGIMPLLVLRRLAV